jgi:hypothetical protein
MLRRRRRRRMRASGKQRMTILLFCLIALRTRAREGG